MLPVDSAGTGTVHSIRQLRLHLTTPQVFLIPQKFISGPHCAFNEPSENPELSRSDLKL